MGDVGFGSAAKNDVKSITGGTIMNAKFVIVVLFFSLFLPMPMASTFAADIEGSKDHPGFKRYEGSEIIKYDHRAYDSLIIALGKARNSKELVESMQLEGTITRLTYKIPMGRSPLEVIRNYENEFSENGFQILFESGEKDLGSYFAEAAGYKEINWPPNVPALTLNSDKQRYLVAQKKSSEGNIVTTLYAIENRFWASDLKNVDKGQTLLHVDIIDSKPMETKMVTVDAKEMAEQIATSGSVALYGIYFDTNKATIKSDSTETLEQIAALLDDNRGLRLLVVGHTDSIGKFAYNMELSGLRAESVVKELTDKYSIKRGRLKPIGVSYSCPVASNKSEEGRSKNRRVVLVEDSP